ncbi:MAG: glycosyltransferase family 39 protein [Candidatus Dojkabacteria bacterium]|jgi:4-amino-4-deoxy-L-arabinose transferase-like glycosyltransferase
MSLLQKFRKNKKAPKILLGLTILLFLIFSIYLALNLRMGVSPDSYYHLEVSQAYSETLGIPENTPETYQWRDITRIPYLSLWINGRILNLNEMTFNFDEVTVLRLSNVLTAVGTLIFVYLISKRLIKNKWGQVLPVFLLSNTLMFVFLSSAINYDNLTVLLSTAAIYFLVRFLQEPKKLSHSILIFIFLLLGTLTKSSVLPLAVIIFVIWMLFIFKKKILKEEYFRQSLTLPNILLMVVFFLLIILNFNVYGVNMITFGKIAPSCTQVLTYNQCLENGVFVRSMYKIPTIFEGGIVESARLVFKGERINPLFYLPYWAVEMSKKIVGIMGDRSLFMRYEYLPFYFLFFFVGLYMVFKNRKSLSKGDKALGFIFLSYALVVAYYVNYKAYMRTDWMDLGLQGRYIFPVLPIGYVIFSKYFSKIKNTKVLNILLGSLIAIFLLGNYAYFFANVPTDWFIPEPEWMQEVFEEESESIELPFE